MTSQRIVLISVFVVIFLLAACVVNNSEATQTKEAEHNQISNGTKDLSDAEKQLAVDRERKIRAYNEGKDYNYTLDIIKDYNFSCEKLAYMNDHLIDSTKQVDGGYITGEYRGIFSNGKVEGHFYQYVTEGVLATGQLPKNVFYHLRTDNSTLEPVMKLVCDDGRSFPDETDSCRNPVDKIRDTKKIVYYTTSDFVMYYVNNCIK